MAEFMYADRIPAEILAWGNELAQIRRDIHQHPELGFDTSRTCGVIATKLSEWGVEFDDKLVEGGVIAVVNGNAPGPTVALRADMDAPNFFLECFRTGSEVRPKRSTPADRV